MPSWIRKLWARFGQFFLFCCVGALNTLIQLAVYQGLMHFFSVPYLIASALGYVACTLNGYLLSSRFVFREKRSAANLTKFVAVNVVGFLLNLACMALWVDVLHIHKFLAQLLTLCVTMPTNFFLNKVWTFAPKK